MKLKKTTVITLFLSCSLIALLGLDFWQRTVQQQLTEKHRVTLEQLNEAQSINKRKVELKRKSRGYDREELAQLRVMPLRSIRPLDLFKVLLRTSGELGLVDVEIELVQKKDTEKQENGQPPGGPGTPAVPEVVLPPKVQAVKFRLEGKGAYPDLLKFLEQLASMDRLVRIKGLTIERTADAFPLQEIKLELVAYTFTE